MKSLGHIAQNAQQELIAIGDQLYIAPLSNALQTNGRRAGRWECSIASALRYFPLFRERFPGLNRRSLFRPQTPRPYYGDPQ